MKKRLLFTFMFLFTIIQTNAQETLIPIYDSVLFYDGYAGLVDVPTSSDVIRLRNDLFTKNLPAM